MLELYLFLGSLLFIGLIVWRRQWIMERWRKQAFKKQIASRVDALKEEERSTTDKRFKDHLSEEQRNKKPDLTKARSIFRQAEMAMAKREWGQAASFLVSALAITDEPLRVQQKLARVYLEQGDLRRAESLYQTLLETDPLDGEFHEGLAKICIQKKRYKDAIAHLVKAVEKNERNDHLLVSLGKLYHLLMRPGLAAECFRRAAELKPREVEYLMLLAEACAADEDFDNALFSYEKVLMLEPYNEKAKEAVQKVRIKMKETEVLFSSVIQKPPVAASHS